MSLPIRSTSSIALDEPSKSLLYSHMGWGKTYTARYFADAYGKGIIFSRSLKASPSPAPSSQPVKAT